MAGEIKHEWHGTVLTITSDSGTSSMDLKGDRGNKGCRGPQGRAGVVLNPDGTIDTTGYATEDYVDYAIENIVLEQVDLSDYALKSDIPDVSEYMTEEQVLAVIQASIPASGDEVDY